MENVGDRHHKQCLSRMTAASKQSIKISKNTNIDIINNYSRYK